MSDIIVGFTRQEATVLRFVLGGAPQNPSVDPPSRIAAQEALAKLDAAIAADAKPALAEVASEPAATE